MSQYINKNEVEKILGKLWKEDDGHNPEHRICYNKALEEVQCELDTLEVKEIQEEPTSNGLKTESYLENKYKEILKQLKANGGKLWKG